MGNDFWNGFGEGVFSQRAFLWVPKMDDWGGGVTKVCGCLEGSLGCRWASGKEAALNWGLTNQTKVTSDRKTFRPSAL